MPDDIDSHVLLGLYAELQGLLAHGCSADAFAGLTAAAVGKVPGAQFASVTRSRDDHYQTLAPTDPRAAAADRLQYDLDSGPCVDAVLDEARVGTDDLRHDERWPDFGPQAAAEFDIASMLSIQMDIADDIRASLNMYSRDLHAFSAASHSIGSLLAAHGAVVLGLVLARERIANMETALGNSRRIGMAIGVLMAARQIAADEAFGLMRTASQNSNRKIALIAGDVVATGELEQPGGIAGLDHGHSRPAG